MALTDSEKAKIRRFLGYTDASKGGYYLLEGRMIDLSPEGEEEITQLLTDLADIEAELRKHWRAQRAKKVDEIELWGFDGIAAMRSEGLRLCLSIAMILGVEVQTTPFAPSSDSGIAGRG